MSFGSFLSLRLQAIAQNESVYFFWRLNTYLTGRGHDRAVDFANEGVKLCGGGWLLEKNLFVMVNKLVAFLHVVFVVVWLCVLDFWPYLQVFCLDVLLLVLFIYVIQCARALLIQERKWVEIVWLPRGYTLRCSFSIRCYNLAYTSIQLQILLHNRLLPIRTPHTKIKPKTAKLWLTIFSSTK